MRLLAIGLGIAVIVFVVTAVPLALDHVWCCAGPRRRRSRRPEFLGEPVAV